MACLKRVDEAAGFRLLQEQPALAVSCANVIAAAALDNVQFWSIVSDVCTTSWTLQLIDFIDYAFVPAIISCAFVGQYTLLCVDSSNRAVYAIDIRGTGAFMGFLYKSFECNPEVVAACAHFVAIGFKAKTNLIEAFQFEIIVHTHDWAPVYRFQDGYADIFSALQLSFLDDGEHVVTAVGGSFHQFKRGSYVSSAQVVNVKDDESLLCFAPCNDGGCMVIIRALDGSMSALSLGTIFMSCARVAWMSAVARSTCNRVQDGTKVQDGKKGKVRDPRSTWIASAVGIVSHATTYLYGANSCSCFLNKYDISL